MASVSASIMDSQGMPVRRWYFLEREQNVPRTANLLY
jgi:hypothetical protein